MEKMLKSIFNNIEIKKRVLNNELKKLFYFACVESNLNIVKLQLGKGVFIV